MCALPQELIYCQIPFLFVVYSNQEIWIFDASNGKQQRGARIATSSMCQHLLKENLDMNTGDLTLTIFFEDAI